MFKKIVAIVITVASIALALTPGAFGSSNFIDDTLIVKYNSGTPGTTSIFGWSTGHQTGPDMGLWGTLFYKVIPDSTDSIAVTAVTIRIQEVDINLSTGDTVYTVINDTTVDTMTTTGVAADSSWLKKAFAPNPANGYRAIVSASTDCSSVMYSTFNIWFHIRKKLATFR